MCITDRSIWERITCAALAICCAFCLFAQPIKVNALAIESIIGGVVAAYFAATGINLIIDMMPGENVGSYLYNEFLDFCTEKGQQLTDLIDVSQLLIYNGYLKIKQSISSVLEEFTGWFVNENSVTIDTPVFSKNGITCLVTRGDESFNFYLPIYDIPYTSNGANLVDVSVPLVFSALKTYTTDVSLTTVYTDMSNIEGYCLHGQSYNLYLYPYVYRAYGSQYMGIVFNTSLKNQIMKGPYANSNFNTPLIPNINNACTLFFVNPRLTSYDYSLVCRAYTNSWQQALEDAKINDKTYYLFAYSLYHLNDAENQSITATADPVFPVVGDDDNLYLRLDGVEAMPTTVDEFASAALDATATNTIVISSEVAASDADVGVIPAPEFPEFPHAAFDGVWHYVVYLFEQAADGISFFADMISCVPDRIMFCIYGVAVLVIFGGVMSKLLL